MSTLAEEYEMGHVFEGNAACTVNGNLIETTWEVVTPEDAARILDEQNTHNRNLSGFRVRQLVTEIVSGDFRVTHQGIAFYENGMLADGQHRLKAIAESGLGVILMVTRGLPVRSISAIDIGGRRTVKDAIDLTGGPRWASRPVIAAARLMLRVAIGSAPTQHQTLHYLDQNATVFHECLTAIVDPSSLKLGNAPYMAAIACARARGVSVSMLASFDAVFRGGVPKTGQMAAVRARECAMTRFGGKTGRGEEDRTAVIRLYGRAIHAFVRSEDIRFLRTTETMFYPPPDPTPCP